ncbi:MAG TPA: PTS sugar transporter subunit IIA [Planctomycetota bacterium]|nr:PTS sugar transporter subunit IIA [Planctomycetota bacterium]
MRLADILSEDIIKLGLESEEKEEVFAELIELLVRSRKIADRAAALKAVESREAMGTTGIGRGIAIPHGKDPSIKQLTAALGISREGIEYEAMDNQPVHVVFLVLAEGNNPGPHVQCLAEIARLLQVPGFYKRLLEARTAKEVLDIIRTEE